MLARRQREATVNAAEKLTIQNVSHSFATHAAMPVLDNINIGVAAGTFVSLIGRSGCGKSTLFNMVAGLLRPTEGAIQLDGRDISGRAGLVGYMLQKDLLLPWRTILDNVILGLELGSRSKSECRDLAAPFLKRYGLAGYENSYPRELSGGMRQRVALLRTLLCNTDVILLDEPFSALDAQTRGDMQAWLLDIWSEFGKTIVLVTHDVDEAVYLSDEIFALSSRPGRVSEVVKVDLDRPRDRSVVTSRQFADLKAHCLRILEQ
jgi:ABC-type nitrate/sulfonate/bicarbonate transport system ATPase subunit